MNTAAIIFACVMATIHPVKTPSYPVIEFNSHVLNMSMRHAQFNTATKVITFRDGWDANDMDAFDRKSTATEFARYVWSFAHYYDLQLNKNNNTGWPLLENENIESVAVKCADAE
jgi:hypothetical protein